MDTMHTPMPTVQRLHSFFRTHWCGQYLWGAGSYDGKRKPAIDISSFMALQRILETALKTPDWEIADDVLRHFQLFQDFLKSPRYVGADRHLDNLTGSVTRRDQRRDLLHLARMMKTVHPMAADHVFADNDRVSVIRTEHGWFDGQLQGNVKPGSGGLVVIDDEGGEHYIRHVRDIRPAQ